MTRRNKTIFIGMVCLLFIITLSGCAKPVAKQAQLESDLQNNPSFYSVQPVTINNFKVIKRQTNQDEKTDIVYVTVSVANSQVECTLHYMMVYELYDEGWMLECVSPYQENDWSIIPLEPCATDIPQVALSEENQDVTCNLTDFSQSADNIYRCIFDAECQNTYPYLTANLNYELVYAFDPNTTTWILESNDIIEKSEQWDIAGEWYYSDYDTKFSVTIRALDSQKLTGSYYMCYSAFMQSDRIFEGDDSFEVGAIRAEDVYRNSNVSWEKGGADYIVYSVMLNSNHSCPAFILIDPNHGVLFRHALNTDLMTRK